MTTFETQLRQQLASHPEEAATHPQIVSVLALPDSRRKHRILARLEMHARVHFNVSGGDASWATFDWKTLLAGLLQLLTVLLPLIMHHAGTGAINLDLEE